MAYHQPSSSTAMVEETPINNNNNRPARTDTTQQQAEASLSSMKKVRAACSNCRQSHVACSHELPCRRCVEHGIEATCRYIPRKKRTNFKKRKGPDEEVEDNDSSPLASVNTIPPNSRDIQILPSALSLPDHNSIPTNALVSVKSPESDYSPLTHLLTTPNDLLPFSFLGGPSVLNSSTLNTNIQLIENMLSNESSTTTTPEFDDASWLNQIISEADSSSPSTTPPLSPLELKNWPTTTGTTASRAFILLQEMKAKNERLERLLSLALNDIKELKRQQALTEETNKQLQSFKLHNLSSSTDFNQRGMPAIAMFSLSGVRHGAILQSNEAFRSLVGYSWEDLMKPGFTCCKLFPERFKLKLGKDYQAIMAGEVSSGQDDLAILRGDGIEVPVRAFYHIIFNDMGVPLYKMFYAFPL